MDKKEIQRIYNELIRNDWGSINPYWFVPIEFPVDESKYDSDHIDFQKVLQDIT